MAKHIVWVRLEIESEKNLAVVFSVVDDVLDDGVLQDAINEREDAVCKVTSALSGSDPQEMAAWKAAEGG